MSYRVCKKCNRWTCDCDKDKAGSGTRPATCSVSDDDELCVEYLKDLQLEWIWKRNSTPKNNREMEELDALVSRISKRLGQNAGGQRTAVAGTLHRPCSASESEAK